MKIVKFLDPEMFSSYFGLDKLLFLPRQGPWLGGFQGVKLWKLQVSSQGKVPVGLLFMIVNITAAIH